MGGDVEFGQGLGNANRPKQVDFHGVIKGGIKADRGGGVDENIAGGQSGAAVVVKAEPVDADVASYGGDAAGSHFGEFFLAEVLA